MDSDNGSYQKVVQAEDEQTEKVAESPHKTPGRKRKKGHWQRGQLQKKKKRLANSQTQVRQLPKDILRTHKYNLVFKLSTFGSNSGFHSAVNKENSTLLSF